ncbi:MAG TPA: S49 family peptidase [Candidatus Nanopusillus sp.]|nr:S49 family peptidase [Candidatus Nanopusillus sp.]
MISFIRNIWKNRSTKFFIILSVVFIFVIALAAYVIKNAGYFIHKKTVYVVKIDDVISYKYMDIDKLSNFLENFKGDGLILYIDSPGGGLETFKIVQAIKNLSVPKVCYIKYYGTSAAYWICSQADYIVAEPYAITGSIGGVIMYMNFAGLLRKIGVEPVIIKEGRLKDLGNPYRNLTEHEKEILHRKLKIFVDKFKNDVLNKRNIHNRSAVLSGEWFFGIEAKELGLVDNLGDYETAKNIIAEELNTSKNDIAFVEISFKKEELWISKIFGMVLDFILKRSIENLYGVLG